MADKLISKQDLYPFIKLMRLDKPIGILLLLWPTFWGIWLAAEGRPNVALTILFFLGVILMRSAGCVANDLLDYDFDKHVKRTCDRPLANNSLSKKQAFLLLLILLALAASILFFVNSLTQVLAAVAVILALSYPLMKRFTYLPQVYLGAAFGWSIPMAYAAQTGEISAMAWLLFLANLLWVTAYDTYYAMVDRDDDLKIGVKSTAILFGDLDRIIIALLQVSFLFAMVLVGNRLQLGLYYYLGLGLASCFCLYQFWLTRHRSREACFQAFVNNHWVGMSIFVGIVMHYTFGQ